MKKNKYPEIALCAVDQLQKNADIKPSEAWNKAAYIFYPKSEAARKKSCPRSSFLGLCEKGLVCGVRPGSYLEKGREENKKDAIKGLELLRQNCSLSKISERELWKKISQKTYNHQMHVVFALFKAGYLT